MPLTKEIGFNVYMFFYKFFRGIATKKLFDY